MKPLKDRILEKIEYAPSGCWIFTGGKTVKGYGVIFLSGKENHRTNLVMTHRAMYEIYKGQIPKGQNVCHTCDNPSCINPDHLFVGSQKVNLQDMTAKGRRVCGSQHAENIKRGWTPELREYRRIQTAKRHEFDRMEKAKAAGVPLDWKWCPDCDTWSSPSNFHKNAARFDGLKCVCKSCDTKQVARYRAKRKANQQVS
jgi:hypothetical protein